MIPTHSALTVPATETVLRDDSISVDSCSAGSSGEILTTAHAISARDVHVGYRVVASSIAIVLGFLCTTSILGCKTQEADTNRPKSSFGQRQLEQLFADRPDMRGAIPSNHPVVDWVKKSFNGEHFGARVYWVADSPLSGSGSEFTSPVAGVPAIVRLTGGTELTPIDKWASLVFELHNVLQTDRFDAVSERAYRGEISRDDYATECVRAEYLASLATADFFRDNPLPVKNSKRNSLYAGILATEASFEEYVERHASAGTPPGNYEYFAAHYDDVIAPAMATAATGEPPPQDK